MRFAVTALAALAALAALGDARVAKYNTTSRRLEGVINVHFIVHTHDDVGWLKTVDEYYLGSRNDIQRATVQNILNSVVKELAWNPDRKFIYVEQAFFSRWWNEAEDKMRDLVKTLVANGQLEFINGGWSMHDEANPSFVDMVDQTTLGHRLLLNEFNVTPKTTWQIDPFGHSTFQASVMSSPIAGYSGIYMMRADYQDIQARNQNRTSEWVWAPSPSLGNSGTTFAGIIWGGYCTMGALDMGLGSSTDPINDDTTLEDYNVGPVIESVVNAAAAAVSTYPQGNTGADGTADVFFPVGCDFAGENSATVYTNMDKVIHWLNQDGRVNAFYSTPSIYTAAKLSPGKTYTLRTDDMMPYADGPHAYWSGYFVSRSALKGYVRDTSAVFQAAKQVQAFTGGSPVPADDVTNPLYRLERALGVTQHHDAVAGTSKQHVANDYARRLAWGREDADGLLNAALIKLTGFTAPVPTGYPSWVSCDLANVTICPGPLELGVPAAVALWNSMAQTWSASPVLVPVGLPAGVASYAVYDNAGKPVTAQLVPLSPADLALRQSYYGYNASVPMTWLAFQATLPPAGYATYFLVPAASLEDAPATHASTVRRLRVGGAGLRSSSSSSSSSSSKKRSAGAGREDHDLTGDQTLTNGVLSLTIDGSSGLLFRYANALSGVTAPLGQTFYWYNSSVGNHDDGQPSGAYIFRPNTSETFDVATQPVAVTLVTGPVLNEARQVFAGWMTQKIRLWANATSVDFDMTVGPIPWQDGLGKEIITRYTTDFDTNGTWWSDSNCRDSNKRVYNYRPSWNLTVHEPVAGNYVPVNCFTYMSDVSTGQTLSVVTDRSQGVASLADGALEVMIQRRLQHDDNRGVGEPLNETGLDGNGLIVRTLHRVSLDANPAAAAVSRRGAVADLLYRPQLRFAALGSTTPAQFVASYKPTFSGVQAALPPNVHLLTVHSWGPGKLLLRLSHSFETNEGGSALGTNVNVDLAAIFPPSLITLQSCTETTVTANQPLATAPQWTYNVTGGPATTLPVVPAPPSGSGMTITLTPLSIRTFMCTTAATVEEEGVEAAA